MKRRSACRHARRRDEQGSALVLALVFLTACGVTIGGLLTFSTTTSATATAFRTARGNDYDAVAAMQAAIATVRPGGTCGTGANGFTPGWTLNNPSRPVRVDCFALSTNSAKRTDVFSVCPSSASAPCADNQSLLRAYVVFYDYQSLGGSLTVQTWSSG